MSMSTATIDYPGLAVPAGLRLSAADGGRRRLLLEDDDVAVVGRGARHGRGPTLAHRGARAGTGAVRAVGAGGCDGGGDGDEAGTGEGRREGEPDLLGGFHGNPSVEEVLTTMAASTGTEEPSTALNS